MSNDFTTPRGIVVSIWGKAYVLGVNGQWRLLKLGDVVRVEDRLLTDQDSIVMMTDAHGQVRQAAAPVMTEADRVIAALDGADPQAATAAGLTGGGGGSLQEGLRVERVAEGVTPTTLATALDAAPVELGRATQSNALENASVAAVTASSSNIAALEEGVGVALGLAAPGGSGALQVVVNQVPAIGQIVTAAGMVLAAGSTLAPADVPGLRYLPPADYDGHTPIAPFVYTVSNGMSTATGSVQVDLSAINDAPVATAGTASGNEDSAIAVTLAGSDVDGSIASVRVTALPANGVLLQADGVTAIAAGQVLTPSQAASLLFRPAANFNGDASLAFTVTDNGGATSAPATIAINVNAVNDAPVAVADEVSTVGTAPATVAVLANDTDVDGDRLALSGASVSSALGSVVVNANGSLTFTAAPGVTGAVPVTYTASDGHGGSAEGTLTVHVAVAASVSVDAPTLSNDNTPHVTGSSNLPPGSTVSLAVTDASGAVQTFNTTVQADGSFGADVPAPLADGPFSVAASVTAPGGSSATANDGGSIDTTAPLLSVDAPNVTNDSTPAINGTTDLPVGSTITLTVTSASGAVQTFAATVQAGGGFSADVPSALVDGSFSVVASATDPAGNIASASDTGVVDTVAPSLTVDAPALTNDSTPTITGTTDLPAGSLVTLTVSDALGAVQTLTVAVHAGGAYSVDVPAPLAEGTYTVVASAADAAGNSVSASDSGAIDVTPPMLSVNAPALTNDSTPTLTGTTDLPAGSTVTLTVTGANGVAQSFATTVHTGGSFSADVPSALVQGSFSVVATAVDAAGNPASANDNGAIDASAPSLTVDAPALTNDSTPTITGTTDLPTGTIVSLAITAANGAVQTFSAVVQVGGAYSADVPAALVEGGYTVDAAAANAAGTTVHATDSGAIDLTPPTASLTLDAITADNSVNPAEAATSITVTGTVAGDAHAGDTVTLVVNGNTYTGTVQPGGNFAVAVAGADLFGDPDHRIEASVTTADAAGNSTTATTTRDYLVNHPPVANPDSLAATQDTPVTYAAAQLLGNDTDIDGNTLAIASVTSGAGGTAVLNVDGTVTFIPNADFSGAASFTYAVTDGSLISNTATATVNVAAVNHAAVIGTPSVADVTEDVAVNGSGNLTATGSISIADADAGQAVFSTTVSASAGNLGTLVLASDGSYSYSVANSATQALGATDTKVDTFTISSADGTSKAVAFTIHGANDAAVIGTPSVADVTEDVAVNGSGNLTATGSISIADADAGQAVFSTTVSASAGNLGTLVLASDGSYSYSVANSATQALGATDTKVDTFTISSADGTSKAVAFTIHGANDAAVIGTPSVADVTEDVAVNGSGNLTATGSISIADADAGQAVFSTTVSASAGNLGTLVLASDGSYSYSVANSATQALGATDTKVDTFTISSADGTSKAVAFTIHGANDAAVIGTPSVADVTEDVAVNGSGNLTATGSISIADADAGQAVFSTTVSASAGNLGTLVLASDGSYSYSVANSATQALGATDTKVDTFTISSADGTSKAVAFTIHGANDAAVIGTPSVADVTEDVAVNGSGNLTATGSISIADADAGQAVFSTTVSASAGNLGTLVLASDGSYSYSVANSATQALGATDTKVDTFTISSADGTSKAVAFTIHGANDAAVIGTPSVADVTEDVAVNGSGNLTATGSISIADADAGQAVFSTTVSASAGNLGTLVLASDGSYSYSVANSATQALGATDTKVDTFTISSADGTSKAVAFTIHGANDAAVIGTPSVADVTEDVAVNGSGNLTATGSISIADADAGQAVFSTTVSASAGNLGTLVLASDGSYSYSVANSATQALGATDTKVDTFTISSADGTSKAVAFTIHGANDAAVIGTPSVADVTEDVAVNGSGNLTATGSISIADADAGQAVFSTTVSASAGNLGTLVLASDGSYSYSVANSATQALGATDTKVDTFTISSADGTSKAVAFTIHGANDAAVIGTPSVADVTEDVAVNGSGNLTATGSISIADADAGQAVFSTTVSASAGNLGTLVLASDGSYSYSVANSATQALGATDTKVDTFTISSADGTSKAVAFTIHGANDAAVIGTPSVADVTEDVAVNGSGNLTATGSISIADADAGQAVFSTTVSASAGNLGTLVLASDGSYSYSVANSATQALGATDTKVDTFTISSADGTSKAVAFTIHGANDAAVIGTPSVADVTEDVAVNGSGNLTATGSISIADADAGQAVFSTTVSASAGNLGTLVLASDGSYSYSVANSATQALGATDTKVDTFTISSADGTSKAVAFTIHGANDAAVIGTPSVADVTEDVAVNGSGNLTATGSISIADADAGQAVFSTTVSASAGNLGTLVLASDGSYSYSVANSATQALGATDTKVDTFTISSADGTSKAVAFTIHGANDAAVIGTPSVADVTEDVAVNGSGNLTATGSISIADADAGQAVFSTTVSASAGNLGTLVLASDGSYSYSVANSATQALGATDTKVDTFTISSADGTSKAVAFTIHGANDAAVIGTPSVADVTEDVAVNGSGNLTATGSISIADADAGQAVFSTTVSASAGNLGTLVLASDGSYSYSVANSATQALGATDTKVDTFTISSADGTSKAVAFTIHGANDAAVIGTPSVADVTEDVAVNGSGNLTATGSISIADADAGQAVFSTTVSASAGNLGTLVLASDGSYSYSVANSATQALGATDTKVDTFTISSADGTSKAVAFTIHGANDAAVIGTPSVADVTEDVAVNGSGNLTATGSISIADADAGQAVFSTTVSASAGNLGTLVLASDGSYSYSVANSATQALGATDTKVDTFTISSADGTSKAVAFTIHGANDAAVIGTPSVADVTEDVAVNGSGNLTATGSISIADADAGQAVFSTTVSASAGNLGTLVLASDGSYSYSVANSATQALGATDTKVDTFTISSADGTSKAVAFTIHGANDAAVITGTATGSVTEAGGVANATPGTPNASGSLSIVDVDAGQSSFQTPASLTGTYGAFTFNAATGAWTYALDNSKAATQALIAGQIVHDTLSVASSDGSATRIIDVTVNGANDTAVITGTATGSVTEAGGVANATPGTPNASGSLSIVDVDAGQSSFQTPASLTGTYGAFTFNAATGAWTYALDNSKAATQALIAGQIVHDTLSVASSDGSATRIIDVTVNGANDTAVITGTATGSVTEAGGVANATPGTPNASGSLSIVDVDAGQSSFQTPASLTGTYGAFTFNAATGAWTYALDNSKAATQALIAGQIVHDTLSVASSDGSATQIIDVTVNGANDAPVANADTASTNEDVALTLAPAVLLANDTDVDSGTTLTITSVQSAVNGTVALSGGNVVFTPNANYNGAASFTYTASDGQGGTSTATVNLNVVAVADAPTLAMNGQLFSLNAGGTTISTEPGITQANLEATLGLPSGQLDTFSPPAGVAPVTTNDPGTVNVFDGKATTYTLGLGAGQVASFNWSFFNGEDTASEINSGYNDMVILVVTDPTGAKQYVQLTSSEQVGPNTNGAAADATGTYQLSATTAGEYQFAWLVTNGIDGNKDSSVSISAPTVSIGGVAHGVPVPISIGGGLVDTDGSESLSYTISGVPSGTTFSAGTDNGGGVWSFSAAQIGGLNLLPAAGYTGTLNLNVSAIATEASNGSTATTTQTLAVVIDSTTTSTMGTQNADTLTGTAGNDLLQGFGGNDILNGGDGNDLLYGGDGNDTLNGGNGNNVMYGGAGNDSLVGGTGNDILYGGTGNDTLTGGGGADVFAWHFADRGTAGTPAVDTITDFNSAKPAAGGDVLDLRDLLQGETTSATLNHYLDFAFNATTGNTTIHVSSGGGFTGGSYVASAEDQAIVLQGVDIRATLGLAGTATDSQIITELINRGKLVTDVPPGG